MIAFLTSGFILGLSAGVSPGPLLALIISETLRHNLKAGIKIAFAPLITDIPIVILTLFILSKISHFHAALGGISIIGGCFVLYLGCQNIRSTGAKIPDENVTERSLQKGIAVNFLSPHPYLFWLTVGAPITVKAMEHSLFAAAAFIGSFYFLLVGSKIVIAFIVVKSRSFLAGKVYIFTMRCLGFMLLILAGFLFYDGIKLLTESAPL
ncbi:MAG: LysE family translocator [Desulfobacterales bacterium]|jgi:threonine/homoserine/homoserine lactone efflux protein|nr:LysE family translocator [Desulfobacterales bacterium]